MTPMFPRFGAGWRKAKLFPAPTGPRVRERFAGTASYCTYYDVRQADLIDADPVVVGVWDYVIKASPAEIMALPELPQAGDHVDNYCLPQEAKWLIGFWLNRGSASPKKSRTAYSLRTERQQLIWGGKAKERIARQLPGIAEWTITQGGYEEAPFDDADEFIDPPYVKMGHNYPVRFDRHDELGAFVRSKRSGLIMVCEGPDADWLPFHPLGSIKSTKGRADEFAYVARDGAPLHWSSAERQWTQEWQESLFAGLPLSPQDELEARLKVGGE